MGWRTVTNDDIVATLSAQEVEAFRQSADFTADPVDLLMARTVSTVRGYIAANGSTKLGPEGTLPEMLISPAMDYLAFDILKRMDIKIGDDRVKARERAEDLFKDVANGELPVENYDDGSGTTTAVSKACTPASGKPMPPRMLD